MTASVAPPIALLPSAATTQRNAPKPYPSSAGARRPHRPAFVVRFEEPAFQRSDSLLQRRNLLRRHACIALRPVRPGWANRSLHARQTDCALRSGRTCRSRWTLQAGRARRSLRAIQAGYALQPTLTRRAGWSLQPSFARRSLRAGHAACALQPALTRWSG
jgi:hypothetical protein